MRTSNDLLKSQLRVSATGRKQDLVNRFASFLMGLISNQNQALINSIVNIVNREAGGRYVTRIDCFIYKPKITKYIHPHIRFRWAFNNNEIASSNSRYRKPKLWERQNAFALNQVKFKMEPFFKTVSTIKPPQLIPGKKTFNNKSGQYIYSYISYSLQFQKFYHITV
jgi:hypothetical protein